MGITATLERMFWFDDQARRSRYPNASKLAEHFEAFVWRGFFCANRTVCWHCGLNE